MPHAERTIVIDRPQAEVFAFFADGENDPRWRPGVKSMKREGPLGPGARYRQRIVAAGREVPADIEVTTYDPGERVAFRTVGGPMSLEGSYSFEPAGGGTAVTFTLHSDLSGIKKLILSRPVQKAMNGEMSNLDKAKKILESG